jgi:serine/threonine protein kinase
LDIKPDNILIGKDGKVTIIDFGTHRQVADEPVVIETQGSLPYCDQAGYQAPVSHAIDVYSLGLIIGEILGATSPEAYVNNILREIKEICTRLLADKPDEKSLNDAINYLLTQTNYLNGLTELVKDRVKIIVNDVFKGCVIDAIDNDLDLQLFLYRHYDFPELLNGCTGLAVSEKEGLRANLIELLSSTRGELSTRKTFTELLQATITLTQVSRCTSSSSSSSSSSCISTGHTSSLFPGAPYDSSDDDVYLPSSSEPGTPFGLSSPMPSLSDLSMSPPGLRSTHSSPSSPCSLSSSDFPSGSSPDTGSSVPLDNEDKVTRRAIEAFMSNGF